jgi:hypothetical protein
MGGRVDANVIVNNLAEYLAKSYSSNNIAQADKLEYDYMLA